MRTYKERTQRILNKARAETKRRKTIKYVAILSSLAALVLTVNLVLFIPYDANYHDISKYEGSDYYRLVSTIDNIVYPVRKTNNYKEWGLNNGILIGCAAKTSSPPPTANEAGYVEVTNNQVEGVIEGDLFKRSDEYIYYINWQPEEYHKLNSNEEYSPARFILRTYSFNKEMLDLVSTLAIYPSGDASTDRLIQQDGEMYLSEDCKTVTLIIEELGKYYYPNSRYYTSLYSLQYTTVINIDISDPVSPKEINRQSISGSYVSSRMVDGTLYLVTNFGVIAKPDFDRPEGYLPQIGQYGSMQSLPMDDILLPDDSTSAQYSIISSFDSTTLDIYDVTALFSFTDTIYVSQNHLFVTRDIIKEFKVEKPKAYYSYTMDCTEIACLTYDKEFDLLGTMVADGTIVNQYSMDEYEDVLRVFTTANKNLRSLSESGDTASETLKFNVDTCNLYCYDLNSFELIACVEDFADEDESVKSSRFDGDKVYVCTASVDYSASNIVITDPVFEFDLSDYDNITSTDTGTIPGYSLSLIRFMDGLLGIGYGNDSTILKIEYYKANGEKVDCVAKYELIGCEFSDEFKAYFIDGENGIIGLGVDRFAVQPVQWGAQYLLLRFDGEKFKEVGFFDLELGGGFDYFTGSLKRMRACYVDGYIYIFGESRIKVVCLNNDEAVKESEN